MMGVCSKWMRCLKLIWQKRRENVNNKLITVGFIFFIFAIGIWNIFSPDQKFSEQENRVLTQKPPLLLKDIFTGKFMNDYEAYLSDQFAGKIGWTMLKAKSEQWQGKRETNGVFIAKEGYLLGKFTNEEEAFTRNIEHLQDFSQKNHERRVSLMLVPTSIEFHKEKLPLFAKVASQKDVLETAERRLNGRVDIINVYPSLSAHKQEGIYFKTDHHWTMRGAYYAYVETAEVLGFEPYSIADFSIKNVSDNFLGTYASKVVGFPVQPDTIELFQPRFPVHYEVTDELSGIVTNSLYHWDSLQKRDQYSLFLQGNHSLQTIHSHVKNGRKLAVIKDSYAHAFIPFLANHYDEVHVIDLRYFHSGLNAYLEQNNVNEILLLYNIPNFMADSNLIWLKS